jgi:hypothetical protein
MSEKNPKNNLSVVLTEKEINEFIKLYDAYEKYAKAHNLKLRYPKSLKQIKDSFLDKKKLMPLSYRKLSLKGFNFKNQPLTENNLKSLINVLWRNKIYKTGNRYHGLVELFRDGKYIRTVSMKYIRLIEYQK